MGHEFIKEDLYLKKIIDPQFIVLNISGMKFNCNNLADSYFYSRKNDVVKLFNIAHLQSTGEIVLIGKRFNDIRCLFKNPIKSSYLGIYIINNLSNNYNYWHISDIKHKLIVINIKSKLISIPILHTDTT